MPHTLCDLESAGAIARWRALDDRVMGGVSRSRLRHAQGGHAVFEGEVSLERNGGFASVRSPSGLCGAPAARTCRFDAWGDGRTYKLSLFMDGSDDSVAWQCSFAPPSGRWDRVTLSLDDFEPRWRGRPVPGAPPLDPARLRQAGLLIADRQAGAFSLSLRSILLD